MSAEAEPEQRTEGDTLRLTLPAESASVGSLRSTARGFAERQGVRHPMDVALAVSEACTNVVMHAYGDRAPGPVRLTGYVDRDHVYLEIADEGDGFAARRDSPGLGFGITLISRVADYVEITARAPAGTLVTMGFARATEPQPARWHS